MLRPATEPRPAALLSAPGVATLSVQAPEPFGTRPSEKSAVCRPKLTASIRPPPLFNRLNRKTAPPSAFTANPLLFAEAGRYLLPYTTTSPPAGPAARG